jgi:poly(beta-D-mannuronate) lyase
MYQDCHMIKRIRICIFCFFVVMKLTAQYSIEQLPKAVKDAKPGDTVVVKDGTYRDAEITIIGKGDSTKPIVVRAQTPGGVIISGTSVLRLSGVGVEVNGFYFTNGYSPKGAPIEFRAGDKVANNCRITNCAIDTYDPPSRETEYSWILIYGRNNRLDHNSVVGKLNNGVTLAVILDEERNQQNHHIIEYNYFGERPNLGSNGGETIRVGTSQSSFSSSYTQIQNNYFEHCDGEVEIVSIKSCDNIIRNNTFYESVGVLALRHGDRNLVEGNTFIGNNKPYTGGIRVINEGHIIRNNRFYNLAGDRFFAALAVMNAVPNSLPNRYRQVKNVTIINNRWDNCSNVLFCVGKDNERTLPPENVTIAKNAFYNWHSDTVYTAYDNMSGFHFSDNSVITKSKKFNKPGFKEVIPHKLGPVAGPVQKEECGAAWYTIKITPYKVLSGKKVTVRKGQNTLADAVEKAGAGDLVELTEEGEYLIDKTIAIKNYIRIQSVKNLNTKPIIRYNGTKGKTAMITIVDGGLLELQGVAFDANAFDGKASANAAIAPVAVMKGHYSAFIDRCEFYNFGESGYSAFWAQRTTYADTLVFTNCLFRDMSGDAIYLSAEKEDAGKYSAEYVEVKNCSFYKVLGYAVDLYRGGSDESTTGPTIVVDHCVLEDVNNKERGAGMRLFGVQNATVQNTIFSNTGRGGASIRFDETHWDKIAVTHCNLYNSGKVSSFWGKVITGPMYAIKPTYYATSAYDFETKFLSPLWGKATDKNAIGLFTPIKKIQNPTIELSK